MTRQLTLKLMLLLIAGTVTLSSRPVNACTCAELEAAIEAAEDASAVFVGRVANIGRETRPLFAKGHICTTVEYADGGVVETGSKPCPDAVKGIRVVTFEVLESLQEVAPDRIVVRTNDQSSACGFAFTAGKRYLVYAFEEEDGQLWANRCSRTAVLNRRAVREARRLRKHFIGK